MKIGVVQLREMVVGAVRAAVAEAKRKSGPKPKDIPPITDKAADERLAKKIPTKDWSYSDTLDHSTPLRAANRLKRQGASGMGGWTAESKSHLQKLVEMVVREEIRSL